MEGTALRRCFRFSASVLLFAVLLFVGACSGEKTEGDADAGADEREAASLGTVPPDLVLHGIDGRSMSMRDFAGEIVVMNFWATWNNDSRELLDIMNAIHRRYSRRYKFIAVAMDEGGSHVIKSYMREHPIALDVFVNGEEAARSFGGIAKLPTTIVILRDGRILRRMDGLYRRKRYENLLDGIIRRRL